MSHSEQSKSSLRAFGVNNVTDSGCLRLTNNTKWRGQESSTVYHGQNQDMGDTHETYDEREDICSFLTAFAKVKDITSYIQTIRPVK